MSLARIAAALLLAGGLLVSAPAAAWDSDYGRSWRGDSVLRPGCHDYRFRYRVRPGTDDWSLELFLVDRDGAGLGTQVLDSDLDPVRGRSAFEICGYTTRPGRFRIRGKLSIYEPGNLLSPAEEPTVRWIEPARFRLRRR